MSIAASVLVCALSMLGRSERHFHPIKLVDAVALGGSPTAEAYVTRGPDTINIVTTSGVFREAMKSSHPCSKREAIGKIASMLVHEEWHLRHGADERGAYQAQLTALQVLGFDEHSMVYFGVKKAMLRVVAAPPRVVEATPRIVAATAQPAG
jgi:hypothetical protein